MADAAAMTLFIYLALSTGDLSEEISSFLNSLPPPQPSPPPPPLLSTRTVTSQINSQISENFLFGTIDFIPKISDFRRH